MFHQKTALSWMTMLAVAALVIAACSPAATPAVSTDTAAPPSSVPSDTSVPTTQAVVPNTGATPEATAVTGGGAGATIMVATNSSLGQILTDANGKTLYAFTNDAPDVSNCTGSCATNWPPLAVAQGTMPTAADGITVTLGTLTRADGTLQVTVNHIPVYTWASDANAGDTGGQGKGGVWFALDASGNLVKTTSAAPADTSAAPPAIPTTYP